jgi:phospholipase/carboxylesterase
VATTIEPQTLYDQGSILRYRPPLKTPRRIVLLLHGWTGDETSMWVFTRALSNQWILAPRGPVPATPQGFGWVPHQTQQPSAHFQDFALAAQALLRQLDGWCHSLNVPNLPLDVVGFSQGAALALSLVLSAPQRFQRLACIAGFLPLQAPIVPLHGLNCLIAHGSQDTIIPLEQAKLTYQHLYSCQAQVQICQADVGHKMSAACFQRLEVFLNNA